MYNWQAYSEIYLKIGAILRPNTDTEDLQKLVKEDFERDCLDQNPDADIESSDEDKNEEDYEPKPKDSDDDDEDEKKKDEEE